jgi:hypothetical protein
MTHIDEIQQKLSEVTFNLGEADVEAMYDLIDQLRELENPREFVLHFFDWFEENSQFDLGSPGPFVHFIEEKIDYIEHLASSIKRKPTIVTVWMANRIANSKTDSKELNYWINLLCTASSHPLADQDTLDSALEFMKYQETR